MIAVILLGLMAVSVVGMAWCESHDELSRRFWEEVFRNKNESMCCNTTDSEE